MVMPFVATHTLSRGRNCTASRAFAFPAFALHSDARNSFSWTRDSISQILARNSCVSSRWLVDDRIAASLSITRWVMERLELPQNLRVLLADLIELLQRQNYPVATILGLLPLLVRCAPIVDVDRAKEEYVG